MTRAWMAARGAERFAVAILSGDVATEQERERRAAICRECPTRKRVRVLGAVLESDWCGTPFVAVDGVSCGCLLAGKVSVQSETCPGGRW